ncbi:uncharacterized protein SCHCODRAFT_01122129 [Schizophyllum commune H4-8]|uniref:Transmembrane protein n=1 Tax=Schizophyllum commune (strain H4-8 / FGSC 9210) TaxID=578458 RepID=D8Q1N6_SCHCM|nr:uncharacterized protein SCHCODRAFT_01122129 [Schizophyllum commune H4-8]KAI5895501.1 hypothetical protein SCHCODRAFT_01122129 [Schizophyllum commune H4-8]
MLPLVRRRLLGTLKNPALIIQFVAFALNVISIVGAYDSNPMFVTVCGAVSALVAFLLGVFSRHLARRRVRYPKYDLESPPVSDAEETDDRPLSSATSSSYVASQHSSHPDSETIRYMPRGSPPQSVRSEPTYTGGGLGATGALLNNNASEPSFPYYASVPRTPVPQPIADLPQNTFAFPALTQAPPLPTSSRGLKGLDKFSSFGRASSRLNHLAKENGWSVNNVFTSFGADHARTHVCRVHYEGDFFYFNCARELDALPCLYYPYRPSESDILWYHCSFPGRSDCRVPAEWAFQGSATRAGGGGAVTQDSLLNVEKTFDRNKTMLSVPVIRPVSRFLLRVLSNTGLLFNFLAFALSMAAVIGAFDSNPVFVTICGSLAPVVAILGIFAKRLTLWRSSRRRDDLEASFDAAVQDDQWTQLSCPEAISPATSTSSFCSSSPPRSPETTSALINPWADRATLPWSSSPTPSLPSPSDEAMITTEVTPLILPIQGIDKLSGYTRWRARLRFLAKQNGWAMSEECTLDGPKHIPTWFCRLQGYCPNAAQASCHSVILAATRKTGARQLSGRCRDQHAAVVVLDSIKVLTVNTAGARDLTNDATLANVAGQGYAVQYSINGTFTSIAAWINAIGQLHQNPFDDKVAAKVISALSPFVHAYSGLMSALVDKYSVLVSKGSPLAPDGAIIGKNIAALQFAVAVYFNWLAIFVPTRLAELNELGKKAYDAYEQAAAKYPKPEGKGGSSLKAAGGLDLNISEPAK